MSPVPVFIVKNVSYTQYILKGLVLLKYFVKHVRSSLVTKYSSHVIYHELSSFSHL